jgi:importin subunit alpha-1/8
LTKTSLYCLGTGNYSIKYLLFPYLPYIFLRTGLVPHLIEVLEKGDFKSQKEAAWAITNAVTGGSSEQIIYLIENFPLLKPYLGLLDSKDPRTVRVVLQGLTQIFQMADKIGGTESLCMLIEEVGGLDRLEALQNHENEEVYKNAFALIDTYFGDGVSNRTL